MASIVDLVRPKAAFDPETIVVLCPVLVPQLLSEPAANNKRICGGVGTLAAGARCMADKERREASRAGHDGKDRYHG